MSNPEIKGIVPTIRTTGQLLDKCCTLVLRLGDGEDNANSIYFAPKKFKDLHSKKVLEIGDCKDSAIAMGNATFEGSILTAHSKKVLEIGTGKSNVEALKALEDWHHYNLGWNSWIFGYSKMMSAHSKRVLEVGNGLDNTNALNQLRYSKDLWRPHLHKLVEIGAPPHFVLLLSHIQNGSNTHKPYGGNRSELIKVLTELIVTRGSGADNLSAMKGVFYKNLRDRFSRKIIEIGNAEENEEAVRFCDYSYKEQHKVRARELRENPHPPAQEDYRFSRSEESSTLSWSRTPSKSASAPASAPASALKR